MFSPFFSFSSIGAVRAPRFWVFRFHPARISPMTFFAIEFSLFFPIDAILTLIRSTITLFSLIFFWMLLRVPIATFGFFIHGQRVAVEKLSQRFALSIFSASFFFFNRFSLLFSCVRWFSECFSTWCCACGGMVLSSLFPP